MWTLCVALCLKSFGVHGNSVFVQSKYISRTFFQRYLNLVMDILMPAFSFDAGDSKESANLEEGHRNSRLEISVKQGANKTTKRKNGQTGLKKKWPEREVECLRLSGKG